MNAPAALTLYSKPSTFDSNDQRWQAVQQRDSKADGAFVFSVRTTGVYCRPSCPSRAPRRENVVFHASPAEAERAGFRPCKRCQPNGAGLSAQHAERVARACRILETREVSPSLKELAREVGLGASQFHRIFAKLTGTTPKAYARERRAEALRHNLRQSRTVTEAIYAAGYPSSGRFYSGTSRALGMKPKAFLRGGLGETIRFALGKSSLGFVLVAASDKGVCAIFMGDDKDKLARELQERFPKAELVAADRNFTRTVAAVISLVENPRAGLDLPLDLRGTLCQQKVWQALAKIPLGKTATYAEIARRLGRPDAARAVAGACAANPLAVIIPCHRVVRTDGSLSGYHWGVDRKRALLRKESKG